MTQPNTNWQRDLVLEPEAMWDLERGANALLGPQPPGLERFDPARSVRTEEVDGEPAVVIREFIGWPVSGWPMRLGGPDAVAARLPARLPDKELDLLVETTTGAVRGADVADVPRLRLIAEPAVGDRRPAVAANQLDLGRFRPAAGGTWVHTVIPRVRSFRAIWPWPAVMPAYLAPVSDALGRLQADLSDDHGRGWVRQAFVARAADVLLGWDRWPIAALVDHLTDLARLRKHRPGEPLSAPVPAAEDWLAAAADELPVVLARYIDGVLPPDDPAFRLELGHELTAAEHAHGIVLTFIRKLVRGRLQLRFTAPTPGAALYGPNVGGDMDPSPVLAGALETRAFDPLLGAPYHLTPILPPHEYWWIPKPDTGE